jgi:hypothetical protein
MSVVTTCILGLILRQSGLILGSLMPDMHHLFFSFNLLDNMYKAISK